MMVDDNFLLLSKDLWRQGYIRVPEYCSMDTPHKDCMPSCPEAIIQGREASEIFNLAGLKVDSSDNIWLKDLANYSLTKDDLLDELCHVGSAGEMFTSSAPQDPTFWPLHGNAERFLQLLRELDHRGNLT